MSSFCRSCGTKINEADTFCPNCGAKTDMQAQQAAVYAPVPPKKKKTGLIIGIIAGVVAIGAAVLVLFLTGVLGGGADISEIEGSWYGADAKITFDKNGEARIASDAFNGALKYDYSFKSQTGTIMALEGEQSDIKFTLYKDYMDVDVLGKMYRDKNDPRIAAADEPPPTPVPTPEPTVQPTPRPTEDNIVEADLDPILLKDFIGLWAATQSTYQGETRDMTGMGMAFEFLADGTANSYSGYENAGIGTWRATGPNTIVIVQEDGDEMQLNDIVISGDTMTLTAVSDGEAGSIAMVKTTAQAFMPESTPGEGNAADVLGTWHEQSGEAITMTFNPDGTVAVIDDGETFSGTFTYDAETAAGRAEFGGNTLDIFYDSDDNSLYCNNFWFTRDTSQGGNTGGSPEDLLAGEWLLAVNDMGSWGQDGYFRFNSDGTTQVYEFTEGGGEELIIESDWEFIDESHLRFGQATMEYSLAQNELVVYNVQDDIMALYIRRGSFTHDPAMDDVLNRAADYLGGEIEASGVLLTWTVDVDGETAQIPLGLMKCSDFDGYIFELFSYDADADVLYTWPNTTFSEDDMVKVPLGE